MLVLINEVLLEDSHAHSFVCHLRPAAFMLQKQHWTVTTETVWPEKPEIFIFYPFSRSISRSPWVICTHCENKGIETAEKLNVAHSRTNQDLTYCV